MRRKVMNTIENSSIPVQQNHRTIREFTDAPVPPEILDALFAVINRTASSSGLQHCSVIRITDAEKRRRLSEVCKQEYVARAPELFVFVVDAFRNSRIARAFGEQHRTEGDMDRFFSGFQDAMLAAQNLTNAVESLGMGAVFLGSIWNDPAKTIEILQLPELTFPAVGVGFGAPNQDPQIKPRMDVSLKIFENEYRVADNYKDAIERYDQEMQTYYDLRDANRRVDSFSKQVIKFLSNPNENRTNLLTFLKKQGFDVQT
jgi:nitroreductase